MATGQQWLFPPARPLVEKLGREFFRSLPTQPGVYLMRDAAGTIVYVGKAKNLRQRLRSYCVANPERMSRRHLRMLRVVESIDFTTCATENGALAHEARLLRRLRPKFNRAGVWPGKRQFLTWRISGNVAEFSVHTTPPLGWDRFGPLGSYARRLHGAMVRLLWLSLKRRGGGLQKAAGPDNYCGLPHGWAHNRLALPAGLPCGTCEAELRSALENLFWAEPDSFFTWVRTCLGVEARGDSQELMPRNRGPSLFEQNALRLDLEELESFVTRFRGSRRPAGQMELL